jgi:porphobilinogen synthase
MSEFPIVRLRRLRNTSGIRAMLDFEMPSLKKFIWPVFVVPGNGIKEPINSLPGQYRFSTDELCRALDPLVQSGLGGIMLFGIPEDGTKDYSGSKASDSQGIIPKTISVIRRTFSDLIVFADVCLCAYTDHGHCGPVTNDGIVDNDAAIEILSNAALCYARAGAQGVAPSAMMDGQVATIRKKLDSAQLTDTIIMSYSTKFASSMYGPFRDAEKSSPSKGDRTAYQTSYLNPSLALRESEFDIAEGADILMVKPALFYLDMISRIKATTHHPVAAYNVSGEYTMLSLMAKNGYGDLSAMVKESLAAIFRSGADLVLSYWANQYDLLFHNEKE